MKARKLKKISFKDMCDGKLTVADALQKLFDNINTVCEVDETSKNETTTSKSDKGS